MPNAARNSWTRVALGDVVRPIKDRLPDIYKSGLTHYVRGEDFEPGEVSIRRRSLIGDGMHGPAFHMRFRRRDVLYVSRNPRLRKAAQVEWDGVCANTTYVLRADETFLLQDLLVFIMQTEQFTKFAKRHQRGSTNFYVNWSDLEPYTFALPPLEAQEQIAKTLRSCSATADRYFDALTRTRTLRASALRHFFGSGDLTNVSDPRNERFTDLSRGWKRVRLADISRVVRGSTPRPAQDPRFFDGSHTPWITVGELTKDDSPFLTKTQQC